ncbi:MAG: hypothetical protein EAZ14_07940 [Runella slithyformis]|nr:MAG: hypothetical protein EAZ46_12975 [Runella sp.]TAG23685.1 MAG: hypothetical protein EAZ38_02885 [Cytophagales bacterium]TAG42926.1 MAG: hypothetical protein EAZ32_00455 [Cytophagia bacterium]TAG76443.1 MAG: hypothetical protein EAZ22_18085 [Cytophagales bacterium]TAH10302.1 MAG: hypothetical protein EAZ14_07940 [Runella slithyformis]
MVFVVPPNRHLCTVNKDKQQLNSQINTILNSTIMKSFIITAAVSILAFNHIAEAQAPQSPQKHQQISAMLLASLPTEDLHVEPKAMVLSVRDKQLLALLPTVDLANESVLEVEIAATEKPTTKINKVEDKVNVEVKKVAER